MNIHIQRAAAICGGQASLARLIGVSCPTVNQWVHDIRPVPAGRCPDIERATAGKVSRRDLRPDDWPRIWPELAEPTKEAANA